MPLKICINLFLFYHKMILWFFFSHTYYSDTLFYEDYNGKILSLNILTPALFLKLFVLKLKYLKLRNNFLKFSNKVSDS